MGGWIGDGGSGIGVLCCAVTLLALGVLGRVRRPRGHVERRLRSLSPGLPQPGLPQPGLPQSGLSPPEQPPRGPGDHPGPLPDHLLGEVVSAVIEAGSPPAEALRHVARTLTAAGDPRAHTWHRVAELVTISSPTRNETQRLDKRSGRPLVRHWARRRRPSESKTAQDAMVGAIADALLLAARSGLPPAALVRECAQTQRRCRAERSARKLARLPVLLVLPLGLCLLPASALLGVAPVVIGLFLRLGL